MVDRIECESRGMVFVESHRNRKGGYVKAHCRKRLRDHIYSDLDRHLELERKKVADIPQDPVDMNSTSDSEDSL